MTIEDWRDEIDLIDQQLLLLLNRRAQLAIEVGAIKRSSGMELWDNEREHDVLARVCAANDGPLNTEATARLFSLIIEESRGIEAEIFLAEELQAKRA
ncbi:MAG: chorismate mutase [Pyrinomonadaceae bacterium]